MTFEVILLALAASGCTAMASVAQRRAAAPAPGNSPSTCTWWGTSSGGRSGFWESCA